MTCWRLAAPIEDIREALPALPALPPRFAIATLVEVDGSAPREVGAQMLITEEAHWGFLSGGCIEEDVARHARAAIASGKPRLLRYGEGSPWIDIRLACGSGISVLVEPVAGDEAALATLIAARAARQTLVWRSDGRTRTATPCAAPPPDGWDGARYTKAFLPPLRLVLVGDDGVALAALALARELGWEVALIAPGGPAEPPCPGIAYHTGAPAAALDAIGIDRWSAIAVLTHDREDDERSLAAALASEAFYVGAIGARARLAARLERLRGHGVSAAALARLHAPIGLHGFGKGPRAVALSLVAEVAQAFHAAASAARSAGVSMSSSAPLSSVSR